jgi:ComF family protein
MAPPPFVKAVASGPYEGRMRELIHALKYDRLHAVAPGLGELLAVTIAQIAADGPAELLVVPIPLHRAKFAERGFNQAGLVAAEAIAFARRKSLACRLELAPHTLKRLRPTESQAGLTPRQRRLNLRGAFGVSNPAAIAGRNVLLVDDILTTGATARAASRVLMDAGAQAVWVATLARARRIEPFFDRAALIARSAAKDSPPTNLAHDIRHEGATMNADHQPSF